MEGDEVAFVIRYSARIQGNLDSLYHFIGSLELLELRCDVPVKQESESLLCVEGRKVGAHVTDIGNRTTHTWWCELQGDLEVDRNNILGKTRLRIDP